jgi:hypothetical protein
VAVGTGRGCGFVEEDGISIHRSLHGVASRARNILVATFQRKRCLLVIEERRLPLVAVVASGALICIGAKLFCMRVLMAHAALLTGTMEVNMQHRKFHIRRLVALGAGHRPMRADKLEIGRRVIELCQVLPLLGGVTGLAPERFAASIARRHAIGKLSFVDIVVTTGATQLIEVIQRNVRAGRRLMTLVACNRPVRIGKRKLRLLVHDQREA